MKYINYLLMFIVHFKKYILMFIKYGFILYFIKYLNNVRLKLPSL
jgi:hypothetical protein